MSCRRPGVEDGFTLLEVLVAAVIAALAVGVLFRGVASGVDAARIAGQVQEATSRAQSRMAVLEHASAVQPGESMGDDGGGFRYRQVVSVAGRIPGLALQDVAVTLSWQGDGRERAVTLRSRRAVPALPEAP